MPCSSPPTTGGLCIGLETTVNSKYLDSGKTLKKRKKRKCSRRSQQASLSSIITIIILLFLVLNSLKQKIYFLPSSFAYMWYYSRSRKTATKRDTRRHCCCVNKEENSAELIYYVHNGCIGRSVDVVGDWWLLKNKNNRLFHAKLKSKFRLRRTR